MSTVDINQLPAEASSDGNDAGNQPQMSVDGRLAEGGNIDKIREILFGVQMRDYEKRFARLEERLLKEARDLRDETGKRFDALENFVKNEFEALTERLQSEQRTREESAQSLSRDLHETGKSLERKISQLDEQTTRSQRELRQQILEQSKNLSDEIRQKYHELSAMVEREVSDLGQAKTDRTALAALFSELSLRLTDEFKIPGNN